MKTANIAASAGSALGILGGIVGTYFSIRNTNSPRERRFMIYAAVFAWFILGLIGAVVFVMPPLRAWGWTPLVVTVVTGVPIINRRVERIRREEARK
jgi:cell division protein FtsW (lipid II flippase)